MIDTYLRYLEFEKRSSINTRQSYTTDLDQLSAFLQGLEYPVSIEKASFHDIRSWVIALVGKGLEARSINRKVATLRSFYKFLVREGVIASDPTRKILALKSSKKLPTFIKELEMLNLLDGGTFKNDFSGIRDRVVLELLYGTGIRLSELLGLTSANIDLHKKVIKVLGKRNKERVIPIPNEVVSTVEQYLNSLAREFSVSTDRIIVTDKGEPAYPMLIYRIVRNFLEQTSAEKNSPHVLRHTFATHLLNKGADLNAVKDLLGHTSLAATQIYTHNSIEKLKNVHKQAHPKA